MRTDGGWLVVSDGSPGRDKSPGEGMGRVMRIAEGMVKWYGTAAFAAPAQSQSRRLLPLFLGERLASHGHVLLVLHQPQQGRASFDPQAIIMVLGVAPGKKR